MRPSIAFVGHVSVDTVRNANGQRTQAGGAALYASLAAKTLLEDVSLVTAIGFDYPHKDLLFKNFSSHCIKLINAPSTKFKIDYDEKWDAHYRGVSLGAGSKIAVKDVLNIPQASFVHLGPMRPLKVLRMVKILKEKLPNASVSMNTCPQYLETTADRSVITKIVEAVDMAIMNERELSMLLGARKLSTHALKLLKARKFVLTLGDFGSLIKVDGDIQFMPALIAVKKPVDTTGAGDSWCGAFLASYCRTRDLAKSASVASVISAIKCMGWGVEKLLKPRFKSVDDVFDYAMSLKDKQPTLWSFLKSSD